MFNLLRLIAFQIGHDISYGKICYSKKVRRPFFPPTTKKFILPLLCLILSVALIILGIFYYREIQSKAWKTSTDPVLSRIGTMMVLPEDPPQITTIDNVEQALGRDAQFFKNAKQGDKLVAYTYLVILFDPKAQKIINVQTFPAPPPTPSTPLRISLRYNGNEEGRANTLKNQLETVSALYQVVEVVKSKATYTGDVLYLINPGRKQDITAFAQAIGNSPILDKLEPGEAGHADADLIVAFQATP